MVFVYQGTAELGPQFFDSLDTEAVAIADPDGDLYRLFDVERGDVRAMFGLRSWKAGIRATLRGHMINRKIGDAWTLPTIVAIRNRTIESTFRGEHAGHLPDLRELFEASA